MRRATALAQIKKFRIEFLSTLSLRRATHLAVLEAAVLHYFYPRSPCGERPVPRHCRGVEAFISIHALLAESDLQSAFSSADSVIFLSTLSLRRATANAQADANNHGFLSTLSLRRATEWLRGRRWRYGISIHALLAESDCLRRSSLCRYTIFLSTLSLRRATDYKDLTNKYFCISIHALLAESDHLRSRFKPCARYFYPRSPCGERQEGHAKVHSTPKISIHALLAESDMR